MKTFQYRVRDKNGVVSDGVLDSVDLRQVANILRERILCNLF